MTAAAINADKAGRDYIAQHAAALTHAAPPLKLKLVTRRKAKDRAKSDPIDKSGYAGRKRSRRTRKHVGFSK
jgi:hypothetical protein